MKDEMGIHCDARMILHTSALTDFVGSLGTAHTRQLDGALRIALALE